MVYSRGKKNLNIPPIYTDGNGGKWRTSDRSVIIHSFKRGFGK